jgi:hypothetical protein
LAVEFLPPKIRQKLLVGETPRELADQILKFLDNPPGFDCDLLEARAMIEEVCQWKSSADQIVSTGFELLRNGESSQT